MRYQEPDQRKIVIEVMIEQVRQAISSGKRVIFSNEAVFTTATLPDRAYAAKKHSVHIEEKLASSPAVAVVAGVSVEIGLEAYYIQARSIESDAFIKFVLTVLERSKTETLTPKPQNPHVYVCGVVSNRTSLIIIMS